MNSSLESTASRPIFGIGRMSTRSRSRSVRNSVIPSVLRGAVLELRRARQQQDLLGLQRLGDPDLAAVDDVAAVVASGERLDPGRVEAGVRLGDAEADVQVAGDDPRQRRLLELLGAVHDHRVHPEDRHVHAAGAVHPGAGGRDLLEQQRGLEDPEAAAAVLLGHADAEPAGVGERLVELPGELVLGVLLEPVLLVEAGGQLGDRPPDRLLVLGELEVQPGIDDRRTGHHMCSVASIGSWNSRIASSVLTIRP